MSVEEIAQYLNQHPEQAQSILSAFTTDDLYKQLSERDLVNFTTVEEIIEEEELLDFASALIFLKAGHKIARSGWNGKGMFIYLVNGTAPYVDELRNEAIDHLGRLYEEGEKVTINGHIDMKAADGSIVVGWLASQTDLLSEDWMIIK